MISLFSGLSTAVSSMYLFNPLGILARRDIYFADVFFYIFIFIYIFNGRLSNTSFSEANRPIFTKIQGLEEGSKDFSLVK